MRCPFCTNEILPTKRKYLEEHLIATVDRKRHFHIHGPISDTELMRLFISKIAKEANIEIEDEEDCYQV